MSNLSELLPAGAGAKSASFVASGTLGSGVTVALKADGTVEAILETSVSQAVGTPAVFESAAVEAVAATFDSDANKVVVAYMDAGNGNSGTSVIGTVSGTSISFGTPVVFNGSSEAIGIVFDSSANKVVVAYRDNTNSAHGYAKVGTVSGTSISFGSATEFENAVISSLSIAFDSSATKVVITYNPGKAVVGTVSGTSISFGSSVSYGVDTGIPSAIFDVNANKIVIAYKNSGNSNYGTAIVGTVSGTSISFGSAVVFESAFTEYISSTFDSNANKVVIAYKDNGNGGDGTAIVGTVSGTSISFGSAVVFETDGTAYISSTFDSNANKVVIAYEDDGNSQAGTFIVGTVSGTSISFGSPVVFETGQTNWTATTFDSASNKVVTAYEDLGNSSYGTAVVFQNASTSTNSTDFIGITDQAIADTATGAVIVQGGVSDKVTGLTTGSDYYVQYNGTLSTTVSSVPAGRALSSTSILLEG